MTRRRRSTQPVPLTLNHRATWRTLWRRCICGLPTPCIDKLTPPPQPPYPPRPAPPAVIFEPRRYPVQATGPGNPHPRPICRTAYGHPPRAVGIASIAAQFDARTFAPTSDENRSALVDDPALVTGNSIPPVHSPSAARPAGDTLQHRYVGAAEVPAEQRERRGLPHQNPRRSSEPQAGSAGALTPGQAYRAGSRTDHSSRNSTDHGTHNRPSQSPNHGRDHRTDNGAGRGCHTDGHRPGGRRHGPTEEHTNPDPQ